MDDDIKYLKDLKNLESLDLANTKISDKGLEYLRKMIFLKTFQLWVLRR